MANAAQSGFASVVALAFVAACRTASLPAPPNAPLTTGNVVALSAGGDHTCALLRDGRVACWGVAPVSIQSGDDMKMVLVQRPTVVDGLPKIVALSMTSGRVCAIADGGSLWCWGKNDHGAILPDRPIDERMGRPVRIGLVTNVRAVTTSEYQTCALEAAGRVVCWGQRNQIDGKIFVAEDDDPVELAGGRYHHCARLRHGEVTCWGAAKMGVLGDDDEGGNTTHAKVSDVVRLAVWGMTTCAWLTDGSTVCWGQHGGRSMPSPEPVDLDVIGFAGESGCSWNAQGKVHCNRIELPGVSGVVQVVAGSSHRCALSRSGDVSCWGSNQHAQLGDETRLAKSRPRVVIPSGARSLAVSQYGICAALDDDRTRCLGGRGEDPKTFALGATSLVSWARVCGKTATGVRCADRQGDFAADVLDVGEIRSFAYDPNAMLAIREDGSVATWPFADQAWYRQQRDSMPKTPPPVYSPQKARTLAGASNVVSIAPTHGGYWLVDRSGALLRASCGRQVHSCELAHALKQQQLEKLPVTRVRAVAAGGMIACALDDDGRVLSWWQGTPNAPPASYTPEPVAGLDRAKAIAAGQGHACAILQDGRVACWGRGDRGEMGDGAFRVIAKPTIVPGIEHAEEIGANAIETCARTSEGKVLCWGGFDTLESNSPHLVTGLPR